MGEIRPHVSKICSLALLGLLITAAPDTAATFGERNLFCTDATPFDLDRLPDAGPPTARFVELAAPSGSHRLDKDGDGGEDEEEGNDEIDIILLPFPSPVGSGEIMEALVRVRQPGILLIDSEDASLEGSLEPTGWMVRSSGTAEVVHTDADGKILAALWPGDYHLRIERGEASVQPLLLRFKFFDPCSPAEGSGEEQILAAPDLCARPLAPGETAVGELANAPGRQSGLFALVLTAWQTVEIETAGNTDTVGELYDRHGHRLAVDDDGGRGVNFRIVRTLSPGRYFVRVKGHRAAEGSYVLSVQRIDR